MTTVWGLVDDRTGHTGQVLGVIAKLGMPYILKRLDYNLLAHAPVAWLGASFASLDRAAAATLAPPYPSLVIAAGARMLPVLRAIKKAAPATRTVYLAQADGTEDIDLIAVPEPGAPNRPNAITIIAPLHAVTAQTLDAARLVWAPQFSHLPRPWVALCLGGNTDQGHYSPAHWRELVEQAQRLAGPGSLLITTSKRTPREALEIARPLLQSPHLLHRWDKDKDNPYLGILACADLAAVTGDSLSMCAEACTTGKPVFIYAQDKILSPEHQQLLASLYQHGMAHPLDFRANRDWKPTALLDDVGHVASEIRRRFPEIF